MMPKSTAFVIFGATGDLAHRKIIPALFLLYQKRKISDFRILCFARQEKHSEKYRSEVYDEAKEHGFFSEEDKKAWDEFEKRIEYRRFDYYDEEEYIMLAKELIGYEKTIFHPAVSFIDGMAILGNLKKLKERKAESSIIKNSSIVIEKPFGEDLRTARKLNAALKTCFKEKQIFRIDHYLGKDAVQNIIAIKFANIFEYLLNKNIVDHVQIIAEESLGVGRRGGYYNRTGTLKDMVQNHLLQLLALVAMDSPASLSAKSMQKEKEKILSSLKPFSKSDAIKNIVLGQYDSGLVNQKRVPAYIQEERIGAGSTTETFACLKCAISNRRWQGVPFYIKTGKRLTKKMTRIIIVFKDAKSNKKLFKTTDKNFISINIYPEQGVSMKINMKKEETFETSSSSITSLQSSSGIKKFPAQNAYMRLLIDVLDGEHVLFQSAKEIEYMWKFIDSIEKNIDREKLGFPNYAAGSDGPRAAKQLIERDGREWMDR